MASSAAAPVIRKLDESVVNRIAAGEVIQRPSSALKEMLENSLDAGSTQINVLVKEGGNKLLQIQDNGHGIRKEDLPILCYRHTTSKLQAFEDLETISTLGFRGEALCSISFVSHMTITTMTGEEPNGWRVTYKDSEMKAPGPQPVASVKGTTISVEDLFYNVPARKKALKSAAEEYGRILDILSRYAVYHPTVGFSCKRQGESRSDLNAPACSHRIDRIRAVYGAPLARDLLPLDLHQGPSAAQERLALGPDDGPAFSANGFVSGVNFANKRTVLILFINGRLVECSGLKRTLEALYSNVVPGSKGGPSGGAGSKPWVFLDLQLPPRQVEVNLHPTKREVGFLHQDHIVEAIRAGVEERLLAANTSRTFTQMQLPFAAIPTESVKERKGDSGSGSPHAAARPQSQPYRPDKLVRVDPSAQSLEAYLSNPYKAAAVGGSVARRKGSSAADPLDLSSDALPHVASAAALLSTPGAPAGTAVALSGIDPSATLSELSSVQELLQEVEDSAHQGLLDILKGHTFVGMADDTWGLLQYETKLYLIDVLRLTRDLFYQQVLRRFEHFPRLTLSPPAPIYELMLLALDVEEAKGSWQPPPPEEAGAGGREEVATLVVQLLKEKGPMLSEYLSIDVDEASGCLTSLPVLLEGHRPDPVRLPSLLWALARDVDWEDEKECFRGLAQALADFYAVRPPLLPPAPADAGASQLQQQQQQQQHTLQGDGQRPDQGTGQGLAGSSAGAGTEEMDIEARPPVQGDGQGVGDDAEGHLSSTSGRGAVDSMGDEVGALEGAGGGRGVEAGPGEAQGGVDGQRGGDYMEIDLDREMDVEGEGGLEGAGEGGEGVQASGEGQGLGHAEGLGREGQQGLQPGEGEAEGASGRGDQAAQGAAAGGSQPGAKGGPHGKLLQQREWTIKNVLFPAMRVLLRPGRQRATDGSCVQVASLERLYRIFERC